MRVKADREKEEAAATKKAVAEIEKAAAAQYERDRAAAEAARKALGSWVRDQRGARARKRRKRVKFARKCTKNPSFQRPFPPLLPFQITGRRRIGTSLQRHSAILL